MSSSPEKMDSTVDNSSSNADAGQEVLVENDAASRQQAPQLKRSLGLLHCTALMVAVTGHSSIFMSPASILSVVGSIGATLIVWLIGGVINMGLALCFAELGTMIPKAGGPYAYIMQTFGSLLGFLTMWGYVVLVAGPFWAFLAYTAALYVIKPILSDCSPRDVDTAIKLLAGSILIALLFLNCVYVKVVTRIQTFLTGTKILALAIIIIGGLYKLCRGSTDNFKSMFEGTTQEPGQFAVGIFYSIFSYAGWQIMSSLMEEVKNPGRNMPLSIYLTFAIVVIQYTLTNVAYFAVIEPKAMVQSNAVALLFMEMFYPPLSVLIAVLVTTTTIGALNASIMGHSRLLFAAARVGHMPMVLGMIHIRYYTPCMAIMVLGLWSLVALWITSLKEMMEFVSLFSTVISVGVILSLFYLRYTKPQQHRPYRTMTLVPVSQLLINVSVLMLAVYQKPHRMGLGMLVILLGLPVYWFGVLWNSKPRQLTHVLERLTIWTQKSFSLVKSR